jgi:hypothetical protein
MYQIPGGDEFHVGDDACERLAADPEQEYPKGVEELPVLAAPEAKQEGGEYESQYYLVGDFSRPEGKGGQNDSAPGSVSGRVNTTRPVFFPGMFFLFFLPPILAMSGKMLAGKVDTSCPGVLQTAPWAYGSL